ncbi:MAG: hypothetical protein F6K48_11850 [Okeania sp. SIO3H1]|nr:hypothetical protein [Okeania sp. SIO3H1]
MRLFQLFTLKNLVFWQDLGRKIILTKRPLLPHRSFPFLLSSPPGRGRTESGGKKEEERGIEGESFFIG